MNRSWTFTALEFRALWERVDDAPMPHPLMYRSAIPYLDDAIRASRQARERLDETLEPWFGDVLERIAQPDIQIIVRGVDAENPERPAGSIRVLGVRRDDFGYVLRQAPAAESADYGSEVTIVECDPLNLAGAVVAELPEVDGGATPELTLPFRPPAGEEFDHDAGSSGLWDSFAEPAHVAGERFLKSPPTAIGGIEVLQGISRFGPRGRVRRLLEWRDLPDDGRYVITGGPPFVAHGADSRRFTALINTEIAAVVRAIKDQRV